MVLRIHKNLLLVFSLMALLASITPQGAARAMSIVVNSSGDNIANDGLCTLREAIKSANTDAASGGAAGECPAGSGADVITFAADFTITLVGNQLPAIVSDMTITGNGAGRTIVQANAAQDVVIHRVFEVGVGVSASLTGMTVRHGRCNSQCATFGTAGGGILNGGTLTLDRMIVTHNTVDNPVPFSSGAAGGGIYNYGHLTIANSIISWNKSGPCLTCSGGGIYNLESVSIDNTLISDNEAVATGGGVSSYSEAGLSFSNSTFARNSAAYGGGVYTSWSGTMNEVTFFGNESTDAALVIGGAPPRRHIIFNSTFVNNDSGGIQNTGTNLFELSGSLVAGNSGPNCAGDPPTSFNAANLSDTATCFGAPATVIPGTHFEMTLAEHGCVTPLADGTCLPTVALLNTGSNPAIEGSTGISADARGYPVGGSIRDVGAYEYTGNFPPAPHSLTATVLNPTQISLSWVNVGASVTKVQRSPAGVGAWTLLDTLGSGFNQYNELNVSCNTAYDYRVQATSPGGDSAPSNVATVTTTPCGPAINLVPASHDFGNQVVGTPSGPFTFTLYNIGTPTTDLHVNSLAASGDFSITNNLCSGADLSRGAGCQFSVTFNPASPGAKTGIVTVSSNANSGSNTVSLSGLGVVAVVPGSPKDGAVVYKSPTLTWKPAQKPLLGYHVEVLDGLGNVILSGDPTKNKFPTSTLPMGSYSWHVAVRYSTGLGPYSPMSDFDLTVLKSPRDGTKVKTHTPKFTWQAVKGATYIIQVNTDPSFPDTPGQMLVNSPAAKNAYTVDKNTPLPSGTFYWRVSVNGVWSLPWMIVIP